LEFREHTLDNGLEVVAECNPEARSMAMGYFVKTGARDESQDVAGVSHFLEHMVFKGTQNRSADDVNREFDEMGADYNAFTSEEKTVYYAAVLPEYQPRAMALLSDILRPALRKDDFDTEKQVIIEEIQMYLDQPPFGADDLIRARHFGKHPLGQSVLGTQQSIKDLEVEAMRAYFERRYSPGNIALVAAGKVDFDALVADAKKFCGNWTKNEVGRKAERAAPHASFESLHRKTATQEYGMQLANGPAAADEDRFAGHLLATILGDDTGSRLYWELVDPGLTESASLGLRTHEGSGVFMTYFSCSPEQTEGNFQRILDIYREVEANGVTAEELSQAKNKLNSRVVLRSERPQGRLFNLGSSWTSRHEYRSVKDDLNAVDAVTLEQIRAVLAKYPLTQSTTVAVGPLKKVKQPK
jgi:predicted Zn-dependent peptidase